MLWACGGCLHVGVVDFFRIIDVLCNLGVIIQQSQLSLIAAHRGASPAREEKVCAAKRPAVK